MFPIASLLPTVFLALSIAASPLERRSSITLPFAKRLNTNGGAISLVKQDQASAAALKQYGTALQSGKSENRRDSGVVIHNNLPASSLVVSVGVGSPPTSYDLIIETSTANTWLGNDKPYKPTSTSKDTNQSVGLYVSSKFFTGQEWLDRLTFTSDLVVNNQSIGIASESFGYPSSVDGVLGLAPSYMTVGTLWSQPQVIFPSVTDNLYDQGDISIDAVSISVVPGGGNTAGELIFGEADPSKYTGQLNYVPITTVKPAGYFWGVDQDITYGDTMVLPHGSGIVNSGVTLILIASDAFAVYKNATGGTLDEITTMLRLTSSQYDNLQNLNFRTGSATLSLTPNGQIWPRALNSYLGGSSSAIYSIVHDLGAPSGVGFDFNLGQSFLERFYTVLDTTHNRVGFATTSHTEATTN